MLVSAFMPTFLSVIIAFASQNIARYQVSCSQGKLPARRCHARDAWRPTRDLNPQVNAREKTKVVFSIGLRGFAHFYFTFYQLCVRGLACLRSFFWDICSEISQNIWILLVFMLKWPKNAIYARISASRRNRSLFEGPEMVDSVVYAVDIIVFE